MKKYIWEGYDLQKVRGYLDRPIVREVPKTIKSKFLVFAFCWDSAPFGYNYWSNINQSLSRGEPLSGYNRDLLTAICTYGGRA